MRGLAAALGVAPGILCLALGRDHSLRRLQWTGLAGGFLSALIFFLHLTAAEGWLALGGLWATTLSVSGRLALPV